MPNTHTTLSALFTDVADAIRAKTGGTADICADNFPAEIAAIPTVEDVTHFRLGSCYAFVSSPCTASVAGMQSAAYDHFIPCDSTGNDVKLDLTQPFEIGCRFQIHGGAGSYIRHIFGARNWAYLCPTIAVGANGFYYYVGTSGSAWEYNAVQITPNGYVPPTNTTISVRLTWDGADFAFRVDDGTDVYTAALSGVTPYYDANYRFEFGGEYKADKYSIASIGASVLLEGTYLQQGDTVIWGKKL